MLCGQNPQSGFDITRSALVLRAYTIAASAASMKPSCNTFASECRLSQISSLRTLGLAFGRWTVNENMQAQLLLVMLRPEMSLLKNVPGPRHSASCHSLAGTSSQSEICRSLEVASTDTSHGPLGSTATKGTGSVMDRAARRYHHFRTPAITHSAKVHLELRLNNAYTNLAMHYTALLPVRCPLR